MLGSLNGKKGNDIEKYVCSKLGGEYALGGLASLEQIGLQEFPVNATHKVVKFEVQEAVMRYLDRMTG